MEAPTYTPLICNKPVTIKKIRSFAIKAYCTDCSNGNRNEVKECPCTDCPLYPFRGSIAWETENKRVLTDEQRQVAGERLKKARESKI